MITRCLLFSILLLMPAAGRGEETAALRAALLGWESAPARPDVQRVSASLVSLAQAELSAQFHIEWVERIELDRLLAETDLAASGRLNPRSSLRVGKLARAQLLVTGRLDAADHGRTTLSLDIIDLQRGDLLASSMTPLPPRPHKHYALRDEDRTTAVSALQSLLAAAASRHRELAAKPTLAFLFLANSGPTLRPDAAGARLADSLRDSAEKAGARVLRFPRVRDAEGEQDLAVLGLAEADDQAWRGVADLYAWGEYKELPEDGLPVDQTPVEASLTLWDGAAPPRVIPWRGTLASFSEAETVFATALRTSLRKTASSTPEARSIAAKLLADQATALERRHASSLRSPDFWSSELGKNFHRHRIFLLQTAAFLQPDSTAVRRALFDAKWNQRDRSAKLPLDALWERYADRRFVTERHPDPRTGVAGDLYQRSLRAHDLQMILSEIAKDLRGENRLRITEARRAALLWVEEANALAAWAATRPQAARGLEEARRSLGDYLIGLGNGPYYPSALGVGIRREMLDGAWPVIAPAFRAWFEERPQFAAKTAERYVQLYAAFGEEDAAYARILAALPDPVAPKIVDDAPSPPSTPSAAEQPDRSPHLPAWTAASRTPAPTALGPELPLRPQVLYRWFDVPPFRSESFRRLNQLGQFNQRLLPPDTVRLLGHDGRRLWIDGMLAPETALSPRRIALLSPDTREFTEISTRLPGESRLVAAAFDQHGVWLATAFEGLTRITAAPAEPARFTPEQGLPSLKLGATASYANGVVAAAAAPETGLARYDATQSRWINLTPPTDHTPSAPAASHPAREQEPRERTQLAGMGPWVLVGRSGVHLLDTRTNTWSADLATRRTDWQKNTSTRIRQRMELMTRLQQARERGDSATVQRLTASMAPAFEWSMETPQALIADESAFWIGGERGLVRYDPARPAAEARVIESPPIIALAGTGRWLWVAFEPDEEAPATRRPGRPAGRAPADSAQPHALGYGRNETPEWRRSRLALFDKHEMRWRGSTEVIGGITSLAASPGRLWAAGSTLLEFDTHAVARPDATNNAASQPAPDIAASWLGLPPFPLHDTVERGDLANLKRLLSAGESPAATAAEGWTPLHLAAHRGDAAAVDALLAAGADLHAFTRDGRNALGLAAAHGDLALVKRLLVAGADPRLQARPHTHDLRNFDPAPATAPTRPPLQPSSSSVSLLPDGRAQVRWQIAADAGNDGFLIYRQDTPADTSAFAAGSHRWGTNTPSQRNLGSMAGMMRSTAREWIDPHPCIPGGTSTYTVVAVNAFDRSGPPDPNSAGSVSAPPVDPQSPSLTFETHLMDRDRSALHLASAHGHADIVAALLSAGAPPDATDAGGRTALHFACANGHTQVAEQLMDAGVPLDTVALGEAGLPDRLLVEAIHPGHLAGAGAHTALSLVYFAHRDEALFRSLLKAGANPVFSPKGGLASIAASFGREEDLNALLDASPASLARDVYGHALISALEAKRFQLARRLREPALDPTQLAGSGPINASLVQNTYYTAVRQSHLETIQWLRSRGHLLSKSSDSHHDPLLEALRQKPSAPIVRELIAAGANPRTLPPGTLAKVTDPEVRAALALAPSTTRVPENSNAPAPRIPFPLSDSPSQALYGPSPEDRYVDPNRDRTPNALRDQLHQAAISGDASGVRAALDQGAAVDAADAKGWTALCHALNARQATTARLLIDAGASLNRLTEFGSSPLCFAAGKDMPDLLDEMLDLGADPNLFASKSGSPLTIALKENVPLAERLLARGADPRLLVELPGNFRLVPPLFVLARHGRLDAVRVLVNHGVDPKTALWRGRWGKEPSSRIQALHFAAASDDVATLEYFLGQGIEPAREDACDDNALDWALCAKADRTATNLRSLNVKSREERGLPPHEH